MLGLRFLPYLLADDAPSAPLRLGCGMGVGAKGGSIRIVARHPQITVFRPPPVFQGQCGEGIPQIVELNVLRANDLRNFIVRPERHRPPV